MIKITHVRFEDGEDHQNIIKLKWINTDSNKKGVSSIDKMIEYVEENPNKVVVEDDEGFATIHVIPESKKSPEYLRTKKDNRETNNLLNLPSF